jgi:abequosyltransferase
MPINIQEFRKKKDINQKLSIVIPSYNRALMLDYSLKTHIPFAREFNIPIYISDNASDDDTSEVVKKWMEDYNLLFYSKNNKNVDTDSNVEIALKIPTSKYVWLLGDSSKISNNIFYEVIKQVNKDYDLIILNNEERVESVQTQLIKDRYFLMTSLGWHMTQISSLVFNREIIINSNFARYELTSFKHLGVIFEYFAFKDNILVSWNQHLSVKRFKIKGIEKKSWQKDTFEIWIKKWSNFVLSLPPKYPIDIKLKMIRFHNNQTKLFSISNLLLLRSNNFYSISDYRKYKKYFAISLDNKSNFKFIFAAILPKKLIKLILFFYRVFIKRT